MSFRLVPKSVTLNDLECIVNGEENPRHCPFPLGISSPPEEDRATAIGNMHKKFGEYRACGSGDMHIETYPKVKLWAY